MVVSCQWICLFIFPKDWVSLIYDLLASTLDPILRVPLLSFYMHAIHSSSVFHKILCSASEFDYAGLKNRFFLFLCPDVCNNSTDTLYSTVHTTSDLTDTHTLRVSVRTSVPFSGLSLYDTAIDKCKDKSTRHKIKYIWFTQNK